MQIIAGAGAAEQTINKSRFVALASYCNDERSVTMMLRNLAMQHPHAHHLAFAFRLKTDQGVIQRFHDAGEPSGTAGKPIMQHIEGRDLINVCVGVIRYYGGINLGTGGLARAYGGTAKMAIDAATIQPFVEMTQIRVTLDYKALDGFTRELGKLYGQILDKTFGERVSVLASLPKSEADALLRRFADQ